jgi:protein-S-isoprenylcysteine O-methyltransferase Ste14
VNTPWAWLITVLWLGFIGYWALAARRVQAAQRKEPTRSRLIHGVLWVLAWALMFTDRSRMGWLSRRFLPLTPGVFALGVVLTALGLGFAIWARRHLGAYWSGVVTIKVEHRLIRSGPYALVRHPIYSGILLAILGTVIALGEVRGLLAFCLATAAFIRKARLEERWLSEQFGDEYRRYQREVKALIPFLF